MNTGYIFEPHRTHSTRRNAGGNRFICSNANMRKKGDFMRETYSQTGARGWRRAMPHTRGMSLRRGGLKYKVSHQPEL